MNICTLEQSISVNWVKKTQEMHVTVIHDHTTNHVGKTPAEIPGLD